MGGQGAGLRGPHSAQAALPHIQPLPQSTLILDGPCTSHLPQAWRGFLGTLSPFGLDSRSLTLRPRDAPPSHQWAQEKVQGPWAAQGAKLVFGECMGQSPPMACEWSLACWGSRMLGDSWTPRMVDCGWWVVKVGVESDFLPLWELEAHIWDSGDVFHFHTV